MERPDPNNYVLNIGGEFDHINYESDQNSYIDHLEQQLEKYKEDVADDQDIWYEEMVLISCVLEVRKATPTIKEVTDKYITVDLGCV